MTVVRVKICGLTNVDDALKASEWGADLLGFIFVETSPRYVQPYMVKEIVDRIPPGFGTVGLFCDKKLEDVSEILRYAALDHVQLHGKESPEYCSELKNMLGDKGYAIKIIKTFKVKEGISAGDVDKYIDADYYLFDTYHQELEGGTGQKFNWELLKDFKCNRPFFLAGGLTAENVAGAVTLVKPFGVDVSSGIERTPGNKDDKKLKEFIHNAKNA